MSTLTLDDIAALEALLAQTIKNSPGPWKAASQAYEVVDGRGDWLADATPRDARLIAAMRNALPDMLALARRALEHERAEVRMHYEAAAADTPAPVETTADDMRHAAAIVCRTQADEPPYPRMDVNLKEAWAAACRRCADRIAGMEVHVSRLVLSDAGGVP